jgi:hypothetical protein
LIHIGDDPKDGRVEIPVNHTGVFGQSGVGKTRLLKYMMAQARAEGFSVLIFDSKVTGAEFEGIGVDLPFYLEESTDPDVFRSLLEGMRTRGHGNMERYRGAFIEVCDGTRSFEDIGRNLKLKLASAKGYYRAMYQEIFYDYGRLMKLLQGESFAPIKAIDFKQPVSRVPTYRLPNFALQGLVVRSMVEALLRKERKLIIIVDEAPNFVNQKKYNPAKDALQTLDAQGRKPEIFGWYSGQTITGFDKANMKNLQFWIMGREMEKNEAKDVFDTQTFKALAVDQIKRMKVREFIVSTPDFAKVVMVPKLEDGYTPKYAQRYTPKALPTPRQLPLPLPKVHGSPGPSAAKPEQSGGASLYQSSQAFAAPSQSDSHEGETRPKPSESNPLDAQENVLPETKQLAAFTLQVTRLESDSLEGKLAYLVKNYGGMRQAELIRKALDYGWVIDQSSASKALKGMVQSGLFVLNAHNDYKFPPEKFEVVEVLAQ